MSQNDRKDNRAASGVRIHAQLAAIMADVEAVGKERRNPQQGFNFRGIEDVVNALHPIFAKHKVFVLSEVTGERTEERATKSGGSLIYRVLTVKVSFVSGEDGSRETVQVVGEGMDSGDKAANKAMSAALKYALSQTLILPYAMTDGDADTPPDSRPRQEPPKAQERPGPTLHSAHDGRTLKPGEDPKPPETPAATEQAQRGAFHPRLYDMMTMSGVTDAELSAFLLRKGMMAKGQTIHTLAEKFVTVMMDGKDPKTGRPNWDVIVDGIKKARDA